MPWIVKKKGSKYQIINKDTKKVVGTSNSKADALGSVRARYANTDPNEINATRK